MTWRHWHQHVMTLCDNIVILRTGSSIEPWPVNLTVSVPFLTNSQVRFAGGWQAFVVPHGFLEGDVLIFELMAMTEFKVYVFRNMEGPYENPSPEQRRCTYNFGQSSEKAKQPYRKCREAPLRSEEEGSNGTIISFFYKHYKFHWKCSTYNCNFCKWHD